MPKQIYHRVCLTRCGYAVVPGATEDEVRRNALDLSVHDFDWEPVTADLVEDELEILETCGPDGQLIQN